jgi:BolA protein
MTRKLRMETCLTKRLTPLLLEVQNESNTHQVPKGSETHFKVVIVSEAFHTLTRIARHRLVNDLLSNEFKEGLHALSLHLYTPEEWDKNTKGVLASPACRNKRR